MRNFSGFPYHHFLRFHEISYARAAFQMRPSTQPGERPYRDVVLQAAFDHDAMGLDDNLVAKERIAKDTAGSDGTARPHSGFPEQLHAGLDDGIFPADDLRIN